MTQNERLPAEPLETSLLNWSKNLADQGILVTDSDLNVRLWNRWLESHSLSSEAEILGRNLLELYPELKNRRLEQYFQDALSGQARTLAQRFHHYLLPMRPGVSGLGFELMQQSAKIMPLMVEDRVVGTITVIDDVTERVAAEQELRNKVHELELLSQALREGEQWLETTLRSIADAVIATDARGRVTFMNQVAQELTGWKQDDACGQPLEDVFQIVHEQTRAVPENPFFRIIHEGIVIGLADHTLLYSRTGKEIPLDDCGAPIKNEAGEIVGIVLVFRDVTERRRTEAEREALLVSEQQARSQAEMASRLKDEFLATVSHELRTPLNAMLGWTLLLRTGNLDESSARRAIETVERNARMQNRLIEDLLDVSRIITGKLRLDLRPVEILEIVDLALDTVRPAADAKGIKFEYVLDSSIGQVMGDADRLQQIVWNLVSNAIKFTPQGGWIEVRLERVGDQAQIQVRDSGRGISAEFLPFVFDRFRQADAATTRIQGGLGLGLAIVRYLVEAHGGTVSAESRGEGAGAVFRIQLPIIGLFNPASLAVDEPPPPISPKVPLLNNSDLLAGVRILVVGNEADIVGVCQAILKQAGATVRDANSVEEALEALQEWQPEVLIADTEIPEADGQELIRRARQLYSGNGTRLISIALLASAKSDDRLSALAAGYHIHVLKPIVPAELVLVVSSLLR